MTTEMKMISVLSTIFLTLGQISFAAGPGNGGGGSGYQNPVTKEYILLDVALKNPGFKDAHTDSPLNLSPIVKELGYQRINAKDLVAGKKAIELLQKWRSSSPLMVESLLLSLERIPLRFISENVPADYQKDGISNFNLDPSYVSGIGNYSITFGTLVSIEKYNALGDNGRVAFLIHEAARRLVELTGAIGVAIDMYDVVGNIMLNEPNAFTLDTPSFVTGQALDNSSSSNLNLSSLEPRYPNDVTSIVAWRELNRHTLTAFDERVLLARVDAQVAKNGGTIRGISQTDLTDVRKLLSEKIKSLGLNN